MSEARTPYDYTLQTINETATRLNLITGGRSVAGDVAAAVLTAQSNLAIASALLAVADAVARQGEHRHGGRHGEHD
ncbi:hypothetical protein [Nocardia sp. NPDC051981]|uniref:hypothetical protein n=1 Tax=Nocardia sp. NPDC051981 TaxID=3155417 RepID=UPI003416FC9C